MAALTTNTVSATNVEDRIRPVPRRGADTTKDHFLAEPPPIRRNVSAARLACLSDNVRRFMTPREPGVSRAERCPAPLPSDPFWCLRR